MLSTGFLTELLTGLSQCFCVYYAIILEVGKQKHRQQECQKHHRELRFLGLAEFSIWEICIFRFGKVIFLKYHSEPLGKLGVKVF